MSDQSDISQQILRRATESVGVIDVHQPRERYNRAKALLRRHVSPVRHLIVRAGEEAPAATATGLVLVNPQASSSSVRSAEAPPAPTRAFVIRQTAPSGDREQIARTPPPQMLTALPLAPRPPIDAVVDSGAAVTTIERASPVATPASPLPLAAGIPFFNPASTRENAGGSTLDLAGRTTRPSRIDAASIDRAPIQSTAPAIARARTQAPGPASTGDARGGASISNNAPPSRSQELPVVRGRTTAAASTTTEAASWRSNGVRVPDRIARSAAAAVADREPEHLALARPATSVVPRATRAASDKTVHARIPPTPGATLPMRAAHAIDESPMMLAPHVQRMPAAATVAAIAPAEQLPLHSVNTGRITAAIARTATANAAAAATAPATIARASSEPGTVTAIGPVTASPETDRGDRNGGASLNPDRMMSHMLRQIAIERERRGGGRWP